MSELDVRGAMTLINSELQSLESMLTGYAELVSEVRWAQRNTPSEMKGFTVERKTRLVNCLTEAEAGFRAEIVTPADVKIKLTRVLSILQNAASYVEPARTPTVTPAVEEVKRVSAVQKTYKVLRSWSEIRDEYAGSTYYYWEDRLYAADDANGQYQRWVNGRYDNTFTPDRAYIERYVDGHQHGENTGSLAHRAQMRALLGRINALG